MGLTVGDGARHHRAHVSSGRAALHGFCLIRPSKLAPACDHVHAIEIVGEKLIELGLTFLRLLEVLRCEACAVAAILADGLDPRVPGSHVELCKRTVDCGVLLGGIGHAKCSEQVVDAHEIPEQTEAARARRVACLHEAGEAAGILRAIDRADANGCSLTLGPVIGVEHRIKVLVLPILAAVAPDLTADVVAHVATGHAAERRGVGARLCADGSATGNASGLAVADGRDECLENRGESFCPDESVKQSALIRRDIVENVRNISGLDLTRIATRSHLADDVREVAAVGVLDVATGDLPGKSARMALVARATRDGVAAEDREAIGRADCV